MPLYTYNANMVLPVLIPLLKPCLPLILLDCGHGCLHSPKELYPSQQLSDSHVHHPYMVATSIQSYHLSPFRWGQRSHHRRKLDVPMTLVQTCSLLSVEGYPNRLLYFLLTRIIPASSRAWDLGGPLLQKTAGCGPPTSCRPQRFASESSGR